MKNNTCQHMWGKAHPINKIQQTYICLNCQEEKMNDYEDYCENVTFTEKQVDHICFMIGAWYLKWKDKMCDYDKKTNKLAFAKEELKTLICGEEVE